MSFFILISLFSCSRKNDTPEKKFGEKVIELKSFGEKTKSPEIIPEEVPLSGQKDLPKPADNNVVDLKPLNPPAEPEKKQVPVTGSVVPEQVRRPQQGESPRYPADSIIGALGPGEAPPASYRFVQGALRSLLQKGSRQAALENLPPEETERVIGILNEISPEKIRIGGGREEPDGSISYLLRFIGKTQWAGGEVYVRQTENAWNLEDLILDRPGESNQTDHPYRFNFPPYERFF